MFTSRRRLLLGSAFLTTLFVIIVLSIFGVPRHAASASSLEGHWRSSATTDTTETPLMTAEISNNQIEITWRTEDTSFLYWKGTFPVSKTVSDGSEIVSVGDVEAMDGSLMGSQSKTKNFTYKNGKLVYTLTVLGASRNITLER